jgi:hypothetical protein
MGFYRFIQHEKVKPEKLVGMLREQCGLEVGRSAVLVVNDSSDINLQAHAGRIKTEQIGPIGRKDKAGIGFFIHPSLVLGLDGKPLGFSSLQIWHRGVVETGAETGQGRLDKHQRQYARLPIEQKESHKWLKAAKESQECLSQAAQITLIGDRESDVYEEWATVPDQRTHLLIRCCQDRRIAEGKVEGKAKEKGKKLYPYLAQQPCVGSYGFWLRGDPRRKREEREVEVEVRIAAVTLLRPSDLVGEYPAEVGLWAIEVRELPHSVPAGQAPLLWRLLTTHPVDSFEQALQIIEWYSWRWRIEQFFALIKQSGFDLEASQIESPPALQSLLVLAAQASLRVMTLLEARTGDTRPIHCCFDAQEIKVLQKVAPSLQGKTAKQKNPFPKRTLGWAAWVIARMGGWKGYASEHPPGIKTFFSGLQLLASYTHFHQLVCKP